MKRYKPLSFLKKCVKNNISVESILKWDGYTRYILCRLYMKNNYGRLSLPRLRLSRITAYLKEKPGPCFKMETYYCLFVLRFYGPVNPIGHVERGQFT